MVACVTGIVLTASVCRQFNVVCRCVGHGQTWADSPRWALGSTAQNRRPTRLQKTKCETPGVAWGNVIRRVCSTSEAPTFWRLKMKGQTRGHGALYSKLLTEMRGGFWSTPPGSPCRSFFLENCVWEFGVGFSRQLSQEKEATRHQEQFRWFLRGSYQSVKRLFQIHLQFKFIYRFKSYEDCRR